jgi:hypothetical protein
MKKLLVVALSAMLVLGMATVSMAAVTITGEANFTWDVTNEATSSDCKVVFDNAINDTVSVNAAIKGSNLALGFDTYSATIKSDALTLQMGYFGTGFGGSTDLLDKVIADVKGASNLLVTYAISDALAVKLDYLYGPGDYGFIVAYTSDAISADLGMAGGTDPGTAINFAYTMGAIKLYLNYETTDVDEDQIIGALYTGDALSARLEYEVASETMGLKVAYTMANSVVLALKNVADVSSIVATVKF